MAARSGCSAAVSLAVLFATLIATSSAGLIPAAMDTAGKPVSTAAAEAPQVASPQSAAAALDVDDVLSADDDAADASADADDSMYDAASDEGKYEFLKSLAQTRREVFAKTR